MSAHDPLHPGAGASSQTSAGTVVAVSRSSEHGFSKQPQPGIRLIAGEGVEGDAHRGVTVQHQYHLRPGDRILILYPPQPHLPLGPV